MFIIIIIISKLKTRCNTHGGMIKRWVHIICYGDSINWWRDLLFETGVSLFPIQTFSPLPIKLVSSGTQWPSNAYPRQRKRALLTKVYCYIALHYILYTITLSGDILFASHWRWPTGVDGGCELHRTKLVIIVQRWQKRMRRTHIPPHTPPHTHPICIPYPTRSQPSGPAQGAWSQIACPRKHAVATTWFVKDTWPRINEPWKTHGRNRLCVPHRARGRKQRSRTDTRSHLVAAYMWVLYID